MGKYGRAHIGKTFNDGKLVVVDGGDRQSYIKVKCNICAQDSELFGTAIFESSSRDIKRGLIPCGCARNPWWSIQ